MVEGDKLGLKHNNGLDAECRSSRAADSCTLSGLPIPNAYNGINGPSFQSLSDHSKDDHVVRASDLLVAVSASADVHRASIIDLAFSASEELRLMAQEQEPLWVFDVAMCSEVLNVAEYKRRFAPLDPSLDVFIRMITQAETSDLPNLNDNVECLSKNGCMFSYTTEKIDSQASRANGVVFRDPVSLVNMFMDVDKWSAAFSNIVSKAKNVAVLSTGNQESPNGRLQVMVAEFHIPSPLFKTREMYFVRYSRQIDINTWVVADISLETILPNPVITCQRKPSGCLIQALQDGLSMVTWVEHNVECNGVVHSMFRDLIKSGSAFSAKRWISTLVRQCDRIATLEAQNDSNKQGLVAARNGLLKLAERMIKQFNSNISSNMEIVWTPLPVPGAEEIMIKTSFNLENPHIPCGVAITIATSVWLPVKQNHVFDFLRNERNRTKWDILSHGLEIQDAVRISSARNSTDCLSVVSVEPSLSRRAITYLQESYSDSMACYIGYAPVDVPTMNHIMSGGTADSVAILPSGFVLLPDGSSDGNTILTVVFQIMDEQLTTPELLSSLSVLTAYRLMKETVTLIYSALLPQT